MMRVVAVATTLLFVVGSTVAQQPSKVYSKNGTVHIQGKDVMFNIESSDEFKVSDIYTWLNDLRAEVNESFAELEKEMERKEMEMEEKFEEERNATSQMIADLQEEFEESMAESNRTIAALKEELEDAKNHIMWLDPRGKDSEVCNKANLGMIRTDKDSMFLEFCAASEEWKPTHHEPLGSTSASAVDSCKDILDAGDATVGSHIVWYRFAQEDTEETFSHKAICVVESKTSIKYGGGNGDSAAEAAPSCAVIKNVWNRPNGIYYIATDVDEAVETAAKVRCENGVAKDGDGSSEGAMAKSCDALYKDFGLNIYADEDGETPKFWLPTPTSENVAHTESLGDAQITLSSSHSGYMKGLTEYINDGKYQNGAFVHSNYEINPYVQFEFKDEIVVTDVKIYNRPDNCGSRTFYGTGCDGSWRNKEFKGDDQSFEIRVANEPCDKGKTCPGTLCAAKLTKNPASNAATKNGWYLAIKCTKPLKGKYVTFQLPSGKANKQRCINILEMEIYTNAAKQDCHREIHSDHDGKTMEKAGLTCKTIKDEFPQSKDGKYYIKPNATKPAFPVYCDMTKFGGGWTLVEKVPGRFSYRYGEITSLTGERYYGGHYPSQGFYPDSLADRGPNPSAWWPQDPPSLGEERMNDIYRVFGEKTIMRLWRSRSYYQNVCSNHFLQKFFPAADVHHKADNFNLFHAIRNPDLWDNSNYQLHDNRAETSGVKHFTIHRGSDRVCYDSRPKNEWSWYNPDTHTLASNPSRYMLTWEKRDLYADDGKLVQVSRHGIPGDTFSGCEWIFQFNNNGYTRSSCRTDLQQFIWLK
eukprot:m.340348 g.340348  ORF g.340348 m.340348 type:complete len:811 (-) comp19246_c0_seq1:60-2492(-)